MPRRALRTGLSTDWARRSASRPISCMREVRSASRGSPARSGSFSAPVRYAADIARLAAMSSSVSLSIATNTAIAAAKAVGWFLTGSPTLFAETVHSVADVANQVLLRIGEVRGRGGPDELHPFGRGQEKFFWALVSAVSVFFIGCGVNIYHGVHALLQQQPVEPFTPLVLGLLLFALALESFTFVVALREIGGWKGLAENRNNTTVLAVVLEDAVALLGILLTLLVAGVSFVLGPRREF